VTLPAIRTAFLPPGALLDRYREAGDFTDCRSVEVARSVLLADLISAFYSSAAFRPERWLLGALLGRGANSGDVANLAAGTTERFAAWTVEARTADQILLRDYQGKTRSWLMVEPRPAGTQLYFGTAVVKAQSRSGTLFFRTLLGFHRVYSYFLLRSASNSLSI
jgi:Protein of unknown function (DUF2867)